MVRPAPIIFLYLLLGAIAVGCSSVRIQTGPASDEVKTERSTSTAGGLRSSIARHLEQADQLGKGQVLRNFIDSVTNRILNFGQQVAGEWTEGNRGRGQAIPDSEMRTVIDNTVRTERPLLDSYDDIIEYGINHLVAQRFFDDALLNQFQRLRSQYEQIFSLVFYPNGTVADYEDGLQQYRSRFELDLQSLDRALLDYR